MHFTALLIIACFVTAGLALDTTSSPSTTPTSSVCGESSTRCEPVTSASSRTATNTSRSIPYAHANNTGLSSNLSATISSVSPSSSSHMNHSVTTFDSSIAIPTAILTASGTPTPPTTTRYTTVTPSGPGIVATTMPSTQNGSGRKAVTRSALALIFLRMSSLLVT